MRNIQEMPNHGERTVIQNTGCALASACQLGQLRTSSPRPNDGEPGAKRGPAQLRDFGIDRSHGQRQEGRPTPTSRLRVDSTRPLQRRHRCPGHAPPKPRQHCEVGAPCTRQHVCIGCGRARGYKQCQCLQTRLAALNRTSPSQTTERETASTIPQSPLPFVKPCKTLLRLLLVATHACHEAHFH